MKPRRVLGFDVGVPGALCVLSPNGSFGSVIYHRRLPKGLNLAQLREIVGHVMDAFEVDLAAGERPFVGGWPRVTASQRAKFSVIETLCQARCCRYITLGTTSLPIGPRLLGLYCKACAVTVQAERG